MWTWTLSLRRTRAPRYQVGIWRTYLHDARNGVAQLHTIECHRWDLRLSLSKSPHRRKWHSLRCSIRYDMNCVSECIKTRMALAAKNIQQTIYGGSLEGARAVEESKNVDGAYVVRTNTSSCRFVRIVLDGKGWTVPRDIKSFLPRSHPFSAVWILRSLLRWKRWTGGAGTEVNRLFLPNIGNGMRYSIQVEIGVWKK